MKKVLLGLTVFFTLTVAHGQSVMKIKDVYDFNVNDEFQFAIQNVPPNATRIKIIGKYFSVNNDTAFYVRSYNNYSSTVVYIPSPHLVYSTAIGTDTIYYTNLNTPINAQYGNLINDSCNYFHDSLFYSSKYCGELTYEHRSSFGYCFECRCYVIDYGEGLGQTEYHYSDDGNMYGFDQVMYYYKKNSVVCGTPDTSTVLSVDEYKTNLNISVYPNPFCTQTVLQTNDLFDNATLTIDNCFGQTVAQIKNISGQTITFNRDNLASGLYFVRLTEENKLIAVDKLIITDK